MVTLFELALQHRNEPAALLIDKHLTKPPTEKLARICIQFNLSTVLNMILLSGVAPDIKFPDGEPALHKATQLETTDILNSLLARSANTAKAERWNIYVLKFMGEN